MSVSGAVRPTSPDRSGFSGVCAIIGATRGRGYRHRVQVEAITDDAGLARLAPEWQALAAACPTATVFQTWEWNATWWRHYGRAPGRRLCVLAWRDAAGRPARRPRAPDDRLVVCDSPAPPDLSRHRHVRLPWICWPCRAVRTMSPPPFIRPWSSAAAGRSPTSRSSAKRACCAPAPAPARWRPVLAGHAPGGLPLPPAAADVGRPAGGLRQEDAQQPRLLRPRPTKSL